MDEDTLVNVGAYCEQMLAHPTFQFISAFYEQSAIGEMLSTKPDEKQKREDIYARVIAHHQFIAQLNDFVSKKRELTEHTLTADQSDNDDPTVHAIY